MRKKVGAREKISNSKSVLKTDTLLLFPVNLSIPKYLVTSRNILFLFFKSRCFPDSPTLFLFQAVLNTIHDEFSRNEDASNPGWLGSPFL